MPDELVHYVVADQIAHLVLDSQHNKNALSRQMLTELSDGLDRAAQDADVKAVLIRAEGNVFCSGADLTEMASGPEDGPRAMIDLFHKIIGHEKPVVAKVQGAARAGGVGIVGACDIVVAAEHATFALNEVRLALAPAAISLTLLARMTSRAASLAYLTGEAFDGRQAVDFGLVTAAVRAADLDAKVDEVCGALAQGHPQGLRESKKVLVKDLLRRLDEGTDEMAEISARLFASEEAREAMVAFLNRKR